MTYLVQELGMMAISCIAMQLWEARRGKRYLNVMDDAGFERRTSQAPSTRRRIYRHLNPTPPYSWVNVGQMEYSMVASVVP